MESTVRIGGKAVVSDLRAATSRNLSGHSAQGYQELCVRNSLQAMTLQRAVDLYGGVRPLAERLKISRVRIDIWLRGDAPVSEDVFSALIDLLLEHGLREITEDTATLKHAAEPVSALVTRPR